MKKTTKITMAIALILAVMIPTTTYAASKYTKQLTVSYGIVQKIVIDGIDKTPTENLPFVYEGTTYVPLRYVSESLGKEVEWEGSTGTVYIGKNPEAANYLSDFKLYDYDYLYYWRRNNNINSSSGGPQLPADFIMTLNDVEYAKGITIGHESYENTYVVYNLNGEYSKLTGIIGLDDRYIKKAGEEVTVSFYTDNQLAKSLTLKRGNLPQDVVIDLQYCMQLKIIMESEYEVITDVYVIDFVDAILE